MRQLKPDVFEVGAIDWDRRLFDELVPLPNGTSYNAYLVKGSEKTALLDTVDPSKINVLLENLAET
ncbi:MAG: FprA family A-type flavoprotein, partial [Planctomycetota bacterium]